MSIVLAQGMGVSSTFKVRRERSQLAHPSPGVFVTPEPFEEQSMLVFRNGQALSQDSDDGFEVLNSTTIRVKGVMDRNPAFWDDIIMYYEIF